MYSIQSKGFLNRSTPKTRIRLDLLTKRLLPETHGKLPMCFSHKQQPWGQGEGWPRQRSGTTTRRRRKGGPGTQEGREVNEESLGKQPCDGTSFYHIKNQPDVSWKLGCCGWRKESSRGGERRGGSAPKGEGSDCLGRPQPSWIVWNCRITDVR